VQRFCLQPRLHEILRVWGIHIWRVTTRDWAHTCRTGSPGSEIGERLTAFTQREGRGSHRAATHGPEQGLNARAGQAGEGQVRQVGH
jgi:hypothetical protein